MILMSSLAHPKRAFISGLFSKSINGCCAIAEIRVSIEDLGFCFEMMMDVGVFAICLKDRIEPRRLTFSHIEYSPLLLIHVRAVYDYEIQSR